MTAIAPAWMAAIVAPRWEGHACAHLGCCPVCSPSPAPSPAPNKPPAKPDDDGDAGKTGSVTTGAGTVTALQDTGVGSGPTSNGASSYWLLAALLTALGGWAVRMHRQPSR